MSLCKAWHSAARIGLKMHQHYCDVSADSVEKALPDYLLCSERSDEPSIASYCITTITDIIGFVCDECENYVYNYSGSMLPYHSQRPCYCGMD